MGLFNLFKSKNESNTNQSEGQGFLDDLSYIQDMKHISGPWQQYDFLLAAQGYGWDYILDSADYMIRADLDQIGTISLTPALGAQTVELIGEYDPQGKSVKSIQALQAEASMLGLGGISKVVKAPVKIVWINQTRVLRIFSPVKDEDLFTRYAETVIRRSFGTADAMKKGRKA